MPATYYLRGHIVRHGSGVAEDGSPTVTMTLRPQEGGGDRQVVAAGRVAQLAATLLSPGGELVVTGLLGTDGVLQAISVSEL